MHIIDDGQYSFRATTNKATPLWAELILQPFRHFAYVTAHSPTLPSLYLRHSSFSSPSVASPTSQPIQQPFFRFSYVTDSPLTSPGEPPFVANVANSSAFSFPLYLSICLISFLFFVLLLSRLILFSLEFYFIINDLVYFESYHKRNNYEYSLSIFHSSR